MDLADWLKFFGAAFGGGFTVKVLDILYREFRRRSDSSKEVKQFVDQHLDPLLKATDELVGKLVSLANDDFKPLYNMELNERRDDNNDFYSVIFLFARLWANIEIIRRESHAISIVEDERGKKLKSFLDCIESRGVRIVDRVSQRAIGELMLTERKDGPLDTLLFIEFARKIERDSPDMRWWNPLLHVLSRTRHTSERQRVLRYGIVLHALIDTLDFDHHVTRRRPSYPNKLSKKSWRELKYRVFQQYLSFVPGTDKYLGPPKRGRPQRGKAARRDFSPLRGKNGTSVGPPLSR